MTLDSSGRRCCGKKHSSQSRASALAKSYLQTRGRYFTRPLLLLSVFHLLHPHKHGPLYCFCSLLSSSDSKESANGMISFSLHHLLLMTGYKGHLMMYFSMPEIYVKVVNWVADILGKYLPLVVQFNLAHALTFCACSTLCLLVFDSLNAPASCLSPAYLINCYD